MTTLAIGVDLGGTNLRIAAVDSNGKVLEKITTSTQVARGRDQVIDEMCVAIQEVVGKQRNAGELAGIGIGVPGIIEMQTGMLRESPNLPGWHNYPVRDEIQRRLKTTVIRKTMLTRLRWAKNGWARRPVWMTCACSPWEQAWAAA